MNVTYDDSGLRKLVKMMAGLGAIPPKTAQEAAKRGGKIVYTAIRARIPVKTGEMKRGLALKEENSKTEHKRVFRISFAADRNPIFQKPIKRPGLYGGKSKSAYYPASMEHGFLRKSGRVPGKMYMLLGAASVEAGAQKAMIDVLADAVEEEVSKA